MKKTTTKKTITNRIALYPRVEKVNHEWVRDITKKGNKSQSFFMNNLLNLARKTFKKAQIEKLLSA